MSKPSSAHSRIISLAISILLLMTTLVEGTRAESRHLTFLPFIFTPPLFLPNGDFESTPIEWTLIPADEQLIFAQAQLPEGVIPHSGCRAAWLGDHGDRSQSHKQEINQTLKIPAAYPFLKFWMQIDSDEQNCETSKDMINVCVQKLNNESCDLIFIQRLCKGNSTFSWFEQTIPLTSYADELVTLRIQVITDTPNQFSPLSEVYFDDFTFLSP